MPAALNWLVCLMVALACLSDAVSIGTLEAEKLIEGKSRNSIAVTFVLKDKALSFSKPLILVMEQGDNYYVVEQQDPAPSKPVLHVIPRDEVVTVEMQRMAN